MSVYNELNKTLYNNITPYTDCNYTNVDGEYPHTNVQSDLLDCLFFEFKPIFVLEIGSMVGGSCLKIVESLQRLNMNDSCVVCIDPFTGDTNMWDQEQTTSGYKFLQLENGIPTIYKRFLTNTRKYKNKIVPINCTAVTGIKLLARLFYMQKRISCVPSVIYLDSAHYKNETFLEISECIEQLMEPNTVLFGDDWQWEDVQHDVIRAVKHYGTNSSLRDKIKEKLPRSMLNENVLVYDNQWMIFR